MVANLPRCPVCRVAIEPGQNVVFRPDGRVQHPACPEVICPVCARSIRPTEPIRRDGARLLHSNCWMRQARAREAGGMPDVPMIREKILAKLQAGTLPNHLPEKMGGGFGGGHACDGCDEKTQPAQAEYTYELPGGRILRLHIGCAGLWQAELLRRGVKRDQ